MIHTLMDDADATSYSRKVDGIGSVVALLSGALAAVAYWVTFSTPRGAAAIFVSLPCLFVLGRLGSARWAFYAGLLVGVAMYAPHLAFFYQVFGLPGTMLWLVLALPIGLFLVLVYHARRRLSPTWALVMTPILWTGIEYFRSELQYLRFAWLLPGQAAAFLPGAWMLRAGVYGVGFAFALVAAMVVGPRANVRVVGVVASVCLGVLMYVPRRTPVPVESTLHVAGVQLESPTESKVVSELERLANVHPEAQLLVLSEYTFGGPVPAAVREVVRRHHRYLIAGGIKPVDDNHFYDTAFVIGPDGEDAFSQGKSVPVQFMGDGLPAPERRVWDSPWGKLGIAVCYDVSYARVMDDFVREGAQGLILPTMDLEAWGGYERRMLHGRMGPTRAAEYGIPVFGVWSSGASQLIDRRGRLIATGGYPGQGDVIAGPLPLGPQGRVPPDRWFALIATFGAAAFVVFLTVDRVRRGRVASRARRVLPE